MKETAQKKLQPDRTCPVQDDRQCRLSVVWLGASFLTTLVFLSCSLPFVESRKSQTLTRSLALSILESDAKRDLEDDIGVQVCRVLAPVELPGSPEAIRMQCREYIYAARLADTEFWNRMARHGSIEMRSQQNKPHNGWTTYEYSVRGGGNDDAKFRRTSPTIGGSDNVFLVVWQFRFSEVTGIAQEGSTATVQAVIEERPGELYDQIKEAEEGAVELYQQRTQTLTDGYCKWFGQLQNYGRCLAVINRTPIKYPVEYRFARYDDGWRVVERTR